MTFADLTAGDAVFLDANIFVYHFGSDPTVGPACGQLVQRIENHEIQGFTSTHILTEAAHRLMTVEASTLFGWPFAGIAYRLQKHPTEVQKLTTFRQALETVVQSKIRVLTISQADMLAAAALSQQVGLLSNDALVMAVMQTHGLTKLASADRDFDRVPGITRYGPV